MDRRRFLTMVGAGAGLSGLGVRPPHLRAALAPGRTRQAITLEAGPTEIRHDGEVSRAWGINGSVPAPTLRFRRGDVAEIVLRNALDEPTILHWHGLDVPEEADGHPRLAIDPGTEYRYRFRVKDPAGLYWYHPHTHRRTAPQTYRGLAGLLVIEGDEEELLGLDAEVPELPMILRDRRTESADPFAYAAMRMGPDVMMGYLGDAPFVDGARQPTVEVPGGVCRLRLLNASNARLLDLGLSTGDPMTLVGTDGGLLPGPARVERIMMGTGERADLLVDFSRFEPGTRVVLRSHAFEIPGMMGMGMGMMGGRGGPPGDRGGRGMGRGRMAGGRMMGGRGGLPQGAEMDFVTFVVGDRRGPPMPRLPERLAEPGGPVPDGSSVRRSFRFESAMMQHTINGRPFEMDRVDAEVPLGTTEVWTLINDTGFAHPVHVHAGQFRVLSRAGGRGERMPWELGLKDTVLLLPGERVEIAVRFGEYPGLFLLHCHNLEHEDAGMMANFRVVA